MRESAYQEMARYSASLQEFLKNGGTEEEAIKKAQAVVANKLKDPDSAKFRNVAIKQNYTGAKFVCGQVNGKNSYGAYAGSSQFVSGISEATLESTNPHQRMRDLENTGLDWACN